MIYADNVATTKISDIVSSKYSLGMSANGLSTHNCTKKDKMRLQKSVGEDTRKNYGL